MSDNRKYYYMRLKEDFFTSESIMLLESMPNGYKYSVILLKLYLRSLKGEGRLMYSERIPYNPKMLANVINHDFNDVVEALNIFRELELIEVLDSGAIYMLDIQNFIGKTTTEADRKREYRRRIELEKQGVKNAVKSIYNGDYRQISDKCPLEREKEIELERELELKRENIYGHSESEQTKNDIPNNKNELVSLSSAEPMESVAGKKKMQRAKSKTKKKELKQLEESFEVIWKDYPKKAGKQQAKAAYIKAIKAGTTNEEILIGVNRYIKYIQENKIGAQYVKHGSTWFRQESWLDDYEVTLPEEKISELRQQAYNMGFH